jgi:protoheme ferro-lyase
MGIRGRNTFLGAGGEELRLIQSPNADPLWVETVVKWVQEPL